MDYEHRFGIMWNLKVRKQSLINNFKHLQFFFMGSFLLCDMHLTIEIFLIYAQIKFMQVAFT